MSFSRFVYFLSLLWTESDFLGFKSICYMNDRSWEASIISLLLIYLTMQRHFMLIVNLDPLPSLLCTETEPPICSIIFLQIDSPNPIPYEFLFVFSLSFENQQTRLTAIFVQFFMHFLPFFTLSHPVRHFLLVAISVIAWYERTVPCGHLHFIT